MRKLQFREEEAQAPPCGEGQNWELNPQVGPKFNRSFVSNSFDPMDRSRPGLLVHHQLPEFTQTHVHWLGDAIQPSHPLSSPSPPAFNLSQQLGPRSTVFISTFCCFSQPCLWSSSFLPELCHPGLPSSRLKPHTSQISISKILIWPCYSLA